MPSKATSVKQYLAELPEDRRRALSAVRDVILSNLDKGFEEGMQYGMIGYYVPHRLYPAGYHCDPRQPLPFAGLASQKGHMSLYLMSVYADGSEEKWLRKKWLKAGKKLNMGKSCIRFKSLEDVPLDVVGEAFARVSVQKHVEHYERAIRTMSKAATGKAAKASKAGPTKAGARRSTARRKTAST